MSFKLPATTTARTKTRISFLAILLVVIRLTSFNVQAQTSGFTYQGALNDGGTMANGNYDLQFSLWDSVSGGTQVGSMQSMNAVPVSNGIFSVTLDFGASAFSGAARFLEISTRPSGVGGFTLLTPRQSITSTPYAIRAAATTTADTATTATNANQLGGVAANQYAQTNDSRLTDARTPTAGSSNYIQNTNSQQAANFNINGNGTAGGTLAANAVTTATQYNIGQFRVFSVAGSNNAFVGPNAGGPNPAGFRNSFVGAAAGFANSTGGENSFLGWTSGGQNTSGMNNSFYGSAAGGSNTTGSNNSFFGQSAGLLTTTISGVAGEGNSFFGTSAGVQNTSGSNNSFFGLKAGTANVTGGNSFFGAYAGTSNTTGGNNSFFGLDAGVFNTTGGNNSFFGTGAGFSNATNGAAVGLNNSFFGAFSGQNNTTGFDNSFFGEFAGKGTTTGERNAFFGTGAGEANTTGYHNSFFGWHTGHSNLGGNQNTFFGSFSGTANTSGFNNTFYGDGSGLANSTGNENAFFGFQAGAENTTGYHNTIIGFTADLGSNNLSYATAIGAEAIVSTSNTIVLGRSDGSDSVLVPGRLNVALLGSGGNVSLCRNPLFQLSTCSSSLRYKTNVQPFSGGLEVVNRLRPITFDWKQGGMHDVGFGAEDVAAVEPLLVSRNEKGEVEGVKYDRISVALVNAVKEQQAQFLIQQDQIKQQQRLITEQQSQLRALHQEVSSLKQLVTNRRHRTTRQR